MMKARTWIVVVTVVAACGAVAVLVFGDRHDDAPMAATAPSQAGAPARGAARTVNGAANIAPVVAKADAVEQNDDKQYPIDPTPATREEPLTDEEKDPRKVRSIEMLDEAVARTEKRLAEAEAAGDQTAANTARVRIQRLREVRKLRATELEVSP